jgi:hypothetical protein
MKQWFFLLCLFLIPKALFSATPKYRQFKEFNIINKEIRFLELKSKKEISDKKATPLKKYTTAILTAREFKLLGLDSKSIEFYKIANDIKIDIDKHEVKLALKGDGQLNQFPLSTFFESNLKESISHQQYEKAILSLNPYSLKNDKNEKLRIVYDLLNVKMKKLTVKKLYCIDRVQSDLEGYNYEEIICDFLNDYLKEGKKEKASVAFLEDYFLKKDLNQRYLLNIIHDL